jgi:multiple antibiotic resistance protein
VSAFAHDFLYEFVTLLVILDPIATIPIFMTVTAGLERKRSLLVAAYALGIAFLVLLFFIAVGQHLLEALKISMPTFQLAGSLVLLLFALQMILGKLGETAAAIPKEATPIERAVFPLGIPGIAGAGAILTVMLLTDNNTRSFAEQATTTGILVLAMVIFFGVFAGASLIYRLIGKPGIEVVTRVFGLILAGLAMKNMITAIKLSFGLH